MAKRNLDKSPPPYEPFSEATDYGVDGTYALRSAVAVRSSPKAAQRCAKGAGLDGSAHDRSTISSAVMHGNLLHQHQLVDPLAKYTAKLHHLDGRYRLRWLTREPAGLSEARKSVMRITEQGLRASSVISGLRSLVRDGQLQFINVQIKDVVEEALLLLKRELERAGITLRTAFAPTPDIEADRVQLQQVVINLVRNAIDAMTACDGRPRVLNVSASIADRHVCVAVTDTGTGIDPMISERLFDPLYTTKGGGLGLGLSICRKIVTAHGGRLWVEKNTRNGVTFTFAVPFRRAA